MPRISEQNILQGGVSQAKHPFGQQNCILRRIKDEINQNCDPLPRLT